MLTIKNTLSIAAFVCGLLIIFGAPQQASAQLPNGINDNCKNIETKSTTLTAVCTASKGFLITPKTITLTDYYECESVKFDGAELQCSRNSNSANIQEAKKALRTAYEKAYGFGLSNSSLLKTYIKWMFDFHFENKFYFGKYTADGDKDLVEMFITSVQNNAEFKRMIIEKNYTKVYGRGPGPDQIARYLNARISAGYIYEIERNLMKNDSSNLVRGIAVTNAYKDTMGRPPTAAERDKWNPKLAFYDEIVKANRVFLYEPANSSTLIEVVKRALKNKTGKEPDSNQVTDAIVQFSKNKLIYDQMVN